MAAIQDIEISCAVNRDSNRLTGSVDPICRKRDRLIEVKVKLADRVIVTVRHVEKRSRTVETCTVKGHADRSMELRKILSIPIHVTVTGRTGPSTGNCLNGRQGCTQQIARGQEQSDHG